MQKKLLGIISVDFDIILQLLITYFAFVRYWRKKWAYNGKTYDSVRREVLYNILIKFGITMKLVRLIKMCLNETYSKVCFGKHLFNTFPILNCLKQGDTLSSLLFNSGLEYTIRKV
jgi:hypothetical protein